MRLLRQAHQDCTLLGQSILIHTNQKTPLGAPSVRKDALILYGFWHKKPMLAITVDSSFLIAVLLECCSCPCFFSSVVSLISSQNHILFRRSFSCQPAKQKSRYTETSKIGGSFALASIMIKLCIGSVNSETIYLLINHTASRFAFMSGAAMSSCRWLFHFEFHFLSNWCSC